MHCEHFIESKSDYVTQCIGAEIGEDLKLGTLSFGQPIVSGHSHTSARLESQSVRRNAKLGV